MSKKTQQIAVPLISVVLGLLLGALIMLLLAMTLFGATKAFSKQHLGVLRILAKFSAL